MGMHGGAFSECGYEFPDHTEQWSGMQPEPVGNGIEQSRAESHPGLRVSSLRALTNGRGLRAAKTAYAVRGSDGQVSLLALNVGAGAIP